MHHVDRIARLVEATTLTACTDMSRSLVPQRGLLDGEGILDLWEQFQVDTSLRTQQPRRKPEMKPPYGLYFYFYETTGQLIPLYVGKGPAGGEAHSGSKRRYIKPVLGHGGLGQPLSPHG